MASTDWPGWHASYDDPGSDLSRRRRSVQARIEAWLDERPDEDLRVVSACSGDGRDLLEVLARRPDASRMSALLLETDETLAAAVGGFAADHGLARVDVRRADAGRTDSYRDAVPADLVMICGVLGNLIDEDARATVAVTRELAAPGALVICTRGRFGPSSRSSVEACPRPRRWSDVAAAALARAVHGARARRDVRRGRGQHGAAARRGQPRTDHGPPATGQRAEPCAARGADRPGDRRGRLPAHR